MVRREYPESDKVLATWDALKSWQRNKITFDELLLKANIDDVLTFVEKLGGILYLMGIAWTNVLAGARYPGVTAASIDRALERDGVADRRMQFEHHGFLPQRKGSSINIGILNQPAAAAPASDADERGLPTFERETLNLRPFVRRQLPEKTGT